MGYSYTDEDLDYVDYSIIASQLLQMVKPGSTIVTHNKALQEELIKAGFIEEASEAELDEVLNEA